MRNYMCLWIMGLFLVSCSNSNEIIMSDDTPSLEPQIVETGTILALWDSLTAWYGLNISESYPSKLESMLSENDYDYKVINGWVSWDTSKNLLDRAELYLDQNPDILLLVIGGNDGLRALPISDLETNIQSIIDMYEWRAKIVLGWMEILPLHGLTYTRDFKQLYFDIADNNPDVYFLESFLEDVGWVARLNQSDRIHPTSEWYDIIVENLYKFLEDEDIIQK